MSKNQVRMAVCLAGLGLFVVVGTIAHAAEEGKPRLPNIVHIVGDDVGYDDLACYGAKGIKTPNLDRLARDGMRFTSFYSPAPFCTATRAALMTGCYAERVGLPPVLFPFTKIGLNASEVTIAELLKERGYATGLVGKWHLGHQAKFLPPNHGFDFFYGIPYPNDHEPLRLGWAKQGGEDSWRSPPMPLYRNLEVEEEPADLEQLPHRFTVEAIKFIKANRDRPFFLHLANIETHTPWFVKSRFAGKSAAGPYGDAVESLDWTVGEVTAALYHLGLMENTLIVYSSDNGYLPPGSNRSDLPNVYGKYATVDENRTHVVRGGKGTLFEGGVRVSCLMAWKGKIAPGSECAEIAAGFDLYATFAKLAGAAVPADREIDGRDISPLLFGDSSAKSPHEAFYYYHGGRLGGVRAGQWKLLFPGNNAAAKKGKSAASEELYDLEADLGETQDVAAANPEVVAQLRALAEKKRLDLGDTATGVVGQNVRPAGKADN